MAKITTDNNEQTNAINTKLLYSDSVTLSAFLRFRAFNAKEMHYMIKAKTATMFINVFNVLSFMIHYYDKCFFSSKKSFRRFC